MSAREAPEIFKISSANNYELVVLLLRLPLINAATRPLIGRQTLVIRAAAFWGGRHGGRVTKSVCSCVCVCVGGGCGWGREVMKRGESVGVKAPIVS